MLHAVASQLDRVQSDQVVVTSAHHEAEFFAEFPAHEVALVVHSAGQCPGVVGGVVPPSLVADLVALFSAATNGNPIYDIVYMLSLT